MAGDAETRLAALTARMAKRVEGCILIENIIRGGLGGVICVCLSNTCYRNETDAVSTAKMNKMVGEKKSNHQAERECPL